MANINLLYQSFHPGLEENNGFGCEPGFAMAFGQLDDGMAYSNSSELSAPEYSTDDFRMFSFKVARCSKRYVHDWRCCPFAHPTENARRRDPRTVKYLPVPCPDYKRGICLRGDTCPYSHGVYECWLHPAKYKTQLCKEGPHCRRPVCFFAHSVIDLRQPSHLWDGSSGNADQQQATVAAALLQQASSDANQRLQAVAEEEFNNSDPAAAAMTRQMSSDLNNGMMINRGPSSQGSGGSKPGTPPRSPTTSDLPSARSPIAPTASESLGLTSQQSIDSSSQASFPQLASAGDSGPVPALRPRGASFDVAGASDPTVVASAVLQQKASDRLEALSLNDTTNGNGTSNGNGEQQAEPWATKLAEGMTAAAAMSTIPVNERPMLPSSAPRMSNAVARKLGLAPNKAAAAAAAGVTPAAAVTANTLTNINTMGAVPRKASGVVSPPPPRASMDGLLLNTSAPPPTLEQQLAAAMAQGQVRPAAAAYAQPIPMAYMPTHDPTMGNGYMQPASYPPADGTTAIHPALLNLVAAHMTVPQHHQGPPPMVVPSHNKQMDDAVMAQLLHSVQGWNMNNGMPHDGYSHTPHRGSSDGMLGMTGIPSGVNPTPFYLPNDLDAAMNNQAGMHHGNGNNNGGSSGSGSRHGSSVEGL